MLGFSYLSKARSNISCTVCINQTPPAENSPCKNIVKNIDLLSKRSGTLNKTIKADIAKPIQVPKHIKQVNSLYKL